MNEPLNFLQEYCDFSDPHWVWIITGISRAKDNQAGDFRQYMQRLIVSNPEEILECYKRIKGEATDFRTVYRMYVSLNARDAVKTAFNFQHALLDIGFELSKGQQDALVKAKRISSLWKDELAQNANRGTKRILIDIDTIDPVKRTLAISYLETHGAVIRAKRFTPNGFHIVIDACDTRDFIKYCTDNMIYDPKKDKNASFIQRDSLVFVEKWQGIS